MKHLLYGTICSLFTFILPATVFSQKVHADEISSGFTFKGGVSFNSISVNGNNKNLAPAGTDFNTSASPLISVGYLNDIGGVEGKIWFYPQMKIYPFKNSGSQDVLLTSGAVYQHVTSTEKAVVINNIVAFGFTIVQAKKALLLFSGGPAFTLLINNKQIQDKRDISTGTVTTTEQKGRGASYNFNGELSLFLKKHFIIWLGSGTSITTTSFSQYSPKTASVQGGIGYRL